MKVELMIANKLRLAPSNGARRSPAVAIAIGGVALAIAVMLITLAVVTGFQNAVREKVMGFEAPIKLLPLGKAHNGEATDILLSDAIQSAVDQQIPNCNVALGITQPAVLKTPENFAGVNILAFTDNHDFSFEKGNILEGNFPVKENEIAVSKITATKLNLKLGDRIDGCFFVDNSLRLRKLTISGIFSSNFSDYDKLTAYSNFVTLKKLRRLGDGRGDFIEIGGVSLDKVHDSSTQLQLALRQKFNSGEQTEGLIVTTVLETGAAYLGWLDLLDSNVVVILIIMTLVSGFTLISCMFILILQRVGMIGILKSMGASNDLIRRVFLLLGGRIVLFGVLTGNLLGLGLLLLQQNFQLLKLDPEAYYLDAVPVCLTLSNILIVNCGAICIAILLMLIPASLVARISPSKTVRFE